MEIAFALLAGLFIGSFLNVAGLRIPIGESVIHPARSYCPACKHTLGALDLMPVLSYLWSLGKCRYCKTAISPLYPVVEIITAVLYALLVYRFGWTLQSLVYCFILSVLIAVCVSDFIYQIIPDRIILPSLLAAFLGLGIMQGHWLDLLIGAVSGAMLIVLIIWASRGGMGGGDIRLNALIGLLLGWKLMLVSFMIACVLGSLSGGALILAKRVSRKTAIPFGPYLSVAAIVTLVAGNQLLAAYLKLLS